MVSGGIDALETELKSEERVRIDPSNPPSPKDKLLAIRLKELEVELSRQNYQTQLLHVRALELETQRDIRLKELEIEQETGQVWCPPSPGLHGTAAPVPGATSSPFPAASHASPFFMVSTKIWQHERVKAPVALVLLSL
ncbi:hypothetical protein ROHU_009796 [Labeo rohita]|uniref:Uncharacterized protein n=1 Tax=Labeo rohita TaxID=84645 RepID=A0A498M2L7_LABRO|nr:hypothetical protein ROHU_009796 [Labeo rohita]